MGITDVLDHVLTVSNGACGSSLNDDGKGWNSTETVVVAVIVLLVLLICVSTFLIWKRMNVNDLQKEAVNSGQYSLMGTDTADAEPELVVEVEVEADNQVTRRM